MDKNIMDKTSAALKRSTFTSLQPRKRRGKAYSLSKMSVRRRGFFPVTVEGERPWRGEVIGEEYLINWVNPFGKMLFFEL